MTERLTHPRNWGESGFVVAIPAQNEAQRLPRALAALAVDGSTRDVIVIANGCSDATAEIARAGHPVLRVACLEMDRLPGGVGAARRLGLAAALKVAPCLTVLATTDADCVVGPGWGATTTATLQHADVACGRILPDPDEFACLPALVRRHGQLEDLANDLDAELEGLRDPRPYDPLPRHGQTLGASLAIRTEAYLAAGGFEPIPCHEDWRIVARIEAMGGRAARPYDLTVTASCRMHARAPGGMADTIAARAQDHPFLHADINRLIARINALRSAIDGCRGPDFSHPIPTREGHWDVPSSLETSI